VTYDEESETPTNVSGNYYEPNQAQPRL
jgi:hypothetical protein